VIGRLSGSPESASKMLTPVDAPSNVLLIVIGSDRGLCGGFNSNLFRFAEEEIRVRFADVKESGNLHLITLGRKANDYFRRRGYTIVQSHNGFFDRVNYDATARITKQATDLFLNGTYDAVHLVYNEFKSVIAQNRMMEAFLPVAPSTSGSSSDLGDTLYEPSAADLLTNVLPLHLNTQLWRAVLESNASEQGARMAAMDNATENASAIIRELQLKYNQARQAAITTELSEIVSGAEALNG
jgi:F-type H+-transporting ATPase subunit gamma